MGGVVMASHLKLATEGGKRVGRTPKAKRLAAAPSTEAARLRRCLALIREQAAKAHAKAEAAEKVMEVAWLVSGGEDRIIARAVAREAFIECRHATNFAMLIRFCEMAEDGTLVA